MLNVAFSYHRTTRKNLLNRTPRRDKSSTRGFTAAMIAAVKLRFELAVCERHGDVMGRVARAKAHQYAAPLVSARGLERFTNVAGIRNALSGNFQNNVTLLEPAIRSGAF